MAGNDVPKLSLMGYLASISFPGVIEKPLFRKQRIKLGNLLLVSNYLYETGAIIGKLYSKKLPLLWQMFDVECGREKESIFYFQMEAKKRIDSYGKQPESFFHLFWITELSKMDLNLEISPEFKNALGKRIAMEQASPMVIALGTEGIGFGSKYPELATRLLEYQYDIGYVRTEAEIRRYGIGKLPGLQITSLQRASLLSRLTFNHPQQ